MSDQKSRKIGSLLLLLTAAIWGTAFVFQRVGMDRIEPITFTAVRMTLAAGVIGLAALCRRKKAPSAEAAEGAAGKSTIAGGILCGIFLAAASIFQQIGIVDTSAGKAGFLTALYILLVPVLRFLLFRRRTARLVWFAVLLGIIGMYLLCVTDRFRLSQGDALICVCAVLFSGHILCCGHFAAGGDPVRISAIQFLTTAVISWAAAFLLETPDPAEIRAAVLPILYCGIVSGGIGYTLQMAGQKYTDPTVASLLMSLESVFAVLAGALLLQERMSARELSGCVIMFLAIVLVQLPGRKKAEPADAGPDPRQEKR